MKSIQPASPQADDDPHIAFGGDTLLLLKGKERVPAKFLMQSVDGMIPCCLELIVDREAADIAYQNGPGIKLEVCGATVRTQILAQNNQSHALVLLAYPFLRGLARAMAAYDRLPDYVD